MGLLKRVLSVLACLVTLVIMLGFGVRSGRDTVPANDVGVVTADFLRVRQAPSTQAYIVAVLRRGQEVTILAEEDGFYRITAEAEGQEGEVGGTVKGYVAAKFIILKKDEK